MKGKTSAESAKKELSAKQRSLLKKIREKETELRGHERESDRLQRKEHFDYANDEKAEADGSALELIGFLGEAIGLGMNIKKFPRVQRLTLEFKEHFFSTVNPSGTSCE
jgi:hypothetical protein